MKIIDCYAEILTDMQQRGDFLTASTTNQDNDGTSYVFDSLCLVSALWNFSVVDESSQLCFLKLFINVWSYFFPGWMNYPNNSLKFLFNCFEFFIQTQPYVRRGDKDALEKFVDPFIGNQHGIFRFKLFPLLSDGLGSGGKHWTLGQYDTETSEWKFYNSLRTRTSATKDKYLPDLQEMVNLYN